jgi:hypothetical protein
MRRPSYSAAGEALMDARAVTKSIKTETSRGRAILQQVRGLMLY